MPGSPYHEPILQCLPDALKYEWKEVLGQRHAEAMRQLESSRNRLKPYFESDILRWMFGSRVNRLDALRFMREGKIVLLNLAPQNRLSSQLGDAIGGLVLNEVLATARSLPRMVRYPTYLLLDEFQNFVGPDIEAALPEVRQLGIRLILSHQSFAQLERGDYDLTTMIFQAQSRMVFGLQGEDADLVAQELASLTYDPKRIKDEIYSRRQLVTGHKIIELKSSSFSETQADSWSRTFGQNWSKSREMVYDRGGMLRQVRGAGDGEAETKGDAEGGGRQRMEGHGSHEATLAEYEQFLELASRTYYSFEEQKAEWAREIRRLRHRRHVPAAGRRPEALRRGREAVDARPPGLGHRADPPRAAAGP